MITLWANIDTDVILFLQDYPYYLFIFSNSECEEIAEVFSKDNDCGYFDKFIINVDYPSQTYKVKIYGQSDYSNLNPDLADYLLTDSAKVTRGEPCPDANGLLDEYNYPLMDEHNKILTS